ncbi:hypothetical protein [Streptomyces chartreusis]|uniref:hypothetical protein n=1 Tax=Streptomyces chartreusis TaxID=1969 RepID=UPI0036C3BD2A
MLGVIALTALSFTATTSPSQASSPIYYNVTVKFKTVLFTGFIDDGSYGDGTADNTAEMYGYTYAYGSSHLDGSSDDPKPYLRIKPYASTTGWYSPTSKTFAETPAYNIDGFTPCATYKKGSCIYNGDYKKQNTTTLKMSPNESVAFGTNFWDYDEWSADEGVCQTNGLISAAAFGLNGSTKYATLSDTSQFANDGNCDVTVSITATPVY